MPEARDRVEDTEASSSRRAGVAALPLPPGTPIPRGPIAEDRPRAALLMACAAAMLAATTLIAKALGTDALGPGLPPFMVSFGRFLFAWIALATLALYLRPPLRTARPGLHLARVLCGWSGVTMMFAAAARMPLADATAISFLNPVFCMILAIPFLGERPGPWRWTAAAVSLGGAAVLLRPGGEAVSLGALLALGAAVVLGAELIFMKRLTRVEGPFQIILTANTIGLCIAGVAASAVWQAPTPGQWAGMAALGFCMAAAQGFFTNALARADASFVTPLSYLTLLFAALYDAALFGVLPDGVGWTGAGLILAGAALLAWREGRARPARVTA